MLNAILLAFDEEEEKITECLKNLSRPLAPHTKFKKFFNIHLSAERQKYENWFLGHWIFSLSLFLSLSSPTYSALRARLESTQKIMLPSSTTLDWYLKSIKNFLGTASDEQFVLHVQQNPILWDTRCSDYKVTITNLVLKIQNKFVEF